MNFWNERYLSEKLGYGAEPNAWFQSKLENLPTGTILLPAEGEGRNAIWAAQKGWKAFAFDSSSVARDKALAWAKQLNLSIHYECNAENELPFYPEHAFDAIALVYAHLNPELLKKLILKIPYWLKPGGTLIVEAFNKNHSELQIQNPSVGGPKNPELLYQSDFYLPIQNHLHMQILAEELIQLNEGLWHVGTGSVIRLLAKRV